jgi:hypothetical protein
MNFDLLRNFSKNSNDESRFVISSQILRLRQAAGILRIQSNLPIRMCFQNADLITIIAAFF